MSATVQPSAVARGWAERRGLPPRRVRRNHAGRLAPHFANVRPAKFVFSSGGGMGLREGAPEETHRDSHQPPLPSAVYNPNQGKTKGDDEMPELLNNVVHERGGRIRAHASKWDSLRDELGAAKTSFGMSLGDPLGKNAASAGPKVSTEATRGDGETADDTPPATGKAAKPAEELEELLMSKMRTTRPTGETKKSQQPAKANKEEPKKEKKDAFSAAVEIKAKEREEKEKRDKNKTTKRKDEKDETKRVLAFEKKDWTRTVVEGAEVLFLCAAGGIKAAQALASRRELAARSTKRGVARNGTATVAVATSPPTPARPPPAAIAQLGWAADGALIGALAASAFLRRTGASNNVVGRVVDGSVAVSSETPASVGVGAESAPLSAPLSAPVVDPADLESVIARVRAKSRRLRDELSNSRVEAAKAAEAAVKAAAASPGSSAVEPDKLKDVLKAVNLALEEKDEMEKAVQLQKAAMEATARAEAAERIAKDNAERAKMAEEREEKIADRFSKEADRALESLRYLSSLKEQRPMETWTTETTVRRTGPGPFPPGFNPDTAAAAAAAAAAQQQQQQQQVQQQRVQQQRANSLGAGQDRGYIEAFDVEIGLDVDEVRREAEWLGSGSAADAEIDSDDEENVRRGV